MNRSHREEDKSGRDVGLIGERPAKVSGYETEAWNPVEKMLRGDHPTTHIGTIECAGGHMGNHHKYKDGGHVMAEQRRMVEGERDHMRDNMDHYAHAKKGGHMSHGGTPHHRREMEYMEPKGPHTGPTMKKGGHAKKHYAAGGVGKVRKGEY